MKKRIFAILLVLTLALSLLPTAVFATGEDAPAEQQEQQQEQEQEQQEQEQPEGQPEQQPEGEPVVLNDGAREVSSAEELIAAVSAGGNIKMMDDITINGDLTIKGPVMLDLNNHELKATRIEINSEFTATGGTINDWVDITSAGGVIKGGTFSGTVVNYNVISGGTFRGKVGNCNLVVFNPSAKPTEAQITGGDFYGEVTNGPVNDANASGTIIGGSFYGKVTNTGFSMITGGDFHGEVVSNAQRYLWNGIPYGCITGGTFYDGLTDNSTGEGSVQTWTVTYMSSGSEYAKQVVSSGSTLTAPKEPAKNYYQFVEWRTADGKAYDFNTAVTEDITLIAQWSTGLTGEGTAESPYQLSSKDDLKLFRDMVNSGEYGLCAVLTKDIDLNNEEWTPIGNASDYDYDNTKAYSGIFDGGGHTISGLNVTNNSFHAGLFGLISGATVQDLSISGSVTGSYFNCGSIAGAAKENSTIKNCSSHCDVTNTTGAYAGGVVGVLFPNATIIDCYNTGTIHQDPSGRGNPETGGIVGRNSGTIRNCYNVGSVSCNDKTFLGSIAGLNMYSPNSKGTVENCYYLDGTGLNAVGRNDIPDNITKTEPKSATEFADGTVLALLINGRTDSPWDSTCKYVTAAGKTLPVFKGQGDKHDHQWKDGVCSKCQYPCPHKDLKAVAAKAATRYAEGNIAYWYCPTCGAYYKDANATQLISQKDTVIPKLSGGGTTPSKPTKPAAPGKTVKSGKTGDPGVALYAGMTILSLTGCAWLRRKEK